MQMEETQPALELQTLQTPITDERELELKTSNQVQIVSLELQTLQTPIKDAKELESKTSNQLQVSSSRRTRSQMAPDWAVQEMLILVREIASIESDFMKDLPSNQKWKIIAGNCVASGVVKSLNQCHRKWESLLAEYKKIKDWESQSGIGSYWSLESERKMEFGLPVVFDTELFRSIHDCLKAPEVRSRMDTNSDSDLSVIKASGSKKKRPAPKKNMIEEREQEMGEKAVKLQENAELIHAVVKRDPNTVYGFDDLKNPGAAQTEFRRQQGDELIKVLESLVGTLDQLSDLVQESG